MARFDLTEAEHALLASAQEIGQELASLADHQPSSVNRPLIGALAERGLLAHLFPEGKPASAMDLCLIRQGLARSSTHAETAFAMQGLGAYPIHLSDNSDLIDRYVKGAAKGTLVPAFALTEPEAGSDAAGLRLAAEVDGEGFRLTGEKAYISNAPEADFYTVFARTGEGRSGVTAFVIESDSPGLSGSSIDLLSPHPLGRLNFDGVLVERSQVVGEIGAGFAVAMQTLNLFRPSVGAFAVGMAEAARDIALAYAQERQAFGQSILGFQAISHRLADIGLEIEASRLLVYRAALAYDQGSTDHLTALSAMAKLAATETAQRAVDGAIQILGARGLESSHLLSHLYKEVRAPRIYEGTSEIQRNLISRELAAGRWPR